MSKRKVPKAPKMKMMLKLKVDPYRGAAQFAISAAPEGYMLVSMIRRGVIATCKYVRVLEQ